jgi:hypothetical protein
MTYQDKMGEKNSCGVVSVDESELASARLVLRRPSVSLRRATTTLYRLKLRLCRLEPGLHRATSELSRAKLMLRQPILSLCRVTVMRNRQTRRKSATGVVQSTIHSLAADTSSRLGDDVSAGHHVGYHPADATSSVGCVGGTLGDFTSPLRCLQSGSSDVRSAMVDVTSARHYIGYLDRCNIGSKYPM